MRVGAGDKGVKGENMTLCLLLFYLKKNIRCCPNFFFVLFIVICK
jgi:hypothetical protein